MEIRLTLRPGMAGTQRLLARYGERPVCVGYRYDAKTGRRVDSAELVVQDVAGSGRAREPRRSERDLVGVRVDWKESELRAAVKRAGGIWRPRQRLWELSWGAVRALGLQARVADESSEIERRSGHMVPYTVRCLHIPAYGFRMGRMRFITSYTSI